ncbi:hypothetical protein [Lysobacter gummosus]|uniref:hypothetical protein n=1 Tax=Lysobacter gummosus TaxID=262324 RepID=UPI0036387C80
MEPDRSHRGASGGGLRAGAQALQCLKRRPRGSVEPVHASASARRSSAQCPLTPRYPAPT